LRRLLADATPIDPVVCRRDLPGATTILAMWKSTPGLEAARALAAAGQEGEDALIAAAADADTATRRHAMRGLTYIRDARTQSIFLAAIRDADTSTRGDAARGLGRFRDDVSVAALLAALTDQAPVVREEAARALGRIGRRVR
jgi:HEAT repeat protein